MKASQRLQALDSFAAVVKVSVGERGKRERRNYFRYELRTEGGIGNETGSIDGEGIWREVQLNLVASCVHQSLLSPCGRHLCHSGSLYIRLLLMGRDRG